MLLLFIQQKFVSFVINFIFSLSFFIHNFDLFFLSNNNKKKKHFVTYTFIGTLKNVYFFLYFWTKRKTKPENKNKSNLQKIIHSFKTLLFHYFSFVCLFVFFFDSVFLLNFLCLFSHLFFCLIFGQKILTFYYFYISNKWHLYKHRPKYVMLHDSPVDFFCIEILTFFIIFVWFFVGKNCILLKIFAGGQMAWVQNILLFI